MVRGRGETPCEGNFFVPIQWRRIIRQGEASRARGRYTRRIMSSMAHRLFAVRPSSGALLDVVTPVVVLIFSMAQLSHRSINLIAVGLAACATVPLISWRRFPLGVFAMTAAASVLLAGLGFRMALPLGPTVALYLLAGSREREI